MSVKSKISRNIIFGICCFMCLTYEAMTTNRAYAGYTCSLNGGHHYLFNGNGQVVGDAQNWRTISIENDDGNAISYKLQKPERNGFFRAYKIENQNIYIGADQIDNQICEQSAPKLFDSNGRQIRPRR